MHNINVYSTGTHRFGQTRFDREITAEQYDRAMKNNGFLTKSDENDLLTPADSAYGVMCQTVFEQDGKYFVNCTGYDSCD